VLTRKQVNIPLGKEQFYLNIFQLGWFSVPASLFEKEGAVINLYSAIKAMIEEYSGKLCLINILLPN